MTCSLFVNLLNASIEVERMDRSLQMFDNYEKFQPASHL